MLKREITYEDFNGNTVTDVFYFNISKPELIELDVEVKQGLAEWLKQIVETEDRKAIIDQFKKLVLLAYGQKSADGKSFFKTDQLREDFSHTAAYQTLFMELASDADKAADFMKAVLPRDMVGEFDKAVAPPTSTDTPQAKVDSPPAPPQTV